MKKIITTLLLFVSIFAFAQGGALADLKFEEAETAFAKNDYKTTIAKLDEFDKLFGSVTAKSLYLRIVSQDKLFVPNKLYENKTQIDLLVSLRKNTSSYLKAMESEGLDDKFREVYDINEKLKQYPKDKAEWKEKMEREKRIAAEKIKIAEEKKQARLAKIKEYDEKKDQYYREIAAKIDAWEYKDGIKIGMDFNELKKTKKDWFKGHYKYNGGSAYNKTWQKHYGDRFERVETSGDNKVEYYEFQIVQNSYSIMDDTKKAVDKLKAYFGENLVFDELAFDNESHYYVIKSPYSQYKIVLQVFNMKSTKQINIMKVSNLWKPKGFVVLSNDFFDIAYSLDYLDRYVGTYDNGKYGVCEISRIGNLSLLQLKSDNKLFYLTRKKGTDEFVSYYVVIEGKKTFYNDEKEKFGVLFNVEAGTFLIEQKGKVLEVYKKWD